MMGVGGAAKPPTPARNRVLDPLDRASEILFGLIMVLTFTLSIGATEAGREDVRIVLIGAIGCNLAWGIIDAVMYLMGMRGQRRLEASAFAAIRDEKRPAAGRALVMDQLSPLLVSALTEADLERIRLHLKALPAGPLGQASDKEELVAALGVFFLVSLCVFPVVLPFLIIDDVALALRVSNFVAVVLLFLTGFTFGRRAGQPWRSGILMVLVGIALVAVAMALGG
jgi:hypothetical protein